MRLTWKTGLVVAASGFALVGCAAVDGGGLPTGSTSSVSQTTTVTGIGPSGLSTNSSAGFGAQQTGFGVQPTGFGVQQTGNVGGFGVTGGIDAANSEFPPTPLPGECYARITLEPVYETIEEEIVVEAARTETRIIPAVFGDVTEEVVVREAATELVTVPATFRTVVEEVVVRPEARRVIPVEPIYETVMEQVEVVPARTVWKPGRGPIERIDGHTGEILCLVEEPAVYETVERRVLVNPASSREEIIPAVTETITREVVDQPARVEERVIPAQTELVTRRVEVQPAREEIVEIPAVTQFVTRQNLVQQARTEWRSILCETNTTPDIVRDIQRALSSRGFNPGPIDGVFGAQTQAAVDRFQRANGMSGNGITMETLQLLGISVGRHSTAT